MMTPDRNIVKAVKTYDPALYLTWNSYNQFFELWRENEDGRHLLMTPITQSIYRSGAPRAFVQLDERVLWWIYEADCWRKGGGKRAVMEEDSRWQEWQKAHDRKSILKYRDMAKDLWTTTQSIYATKYASKNGKPRFNQHKPQSNWIRPDVQAGTSRRLFSRSSQNAKVYNYRGE